MKLKYKRIILKLSGEALANKIGFGINFKILKNIVKEIKKIHELNIEIAIVIGGGNFWRGIMGKKIGMDKAHADYMGMLATIMNALALQNCLEKINIPTRVQTSIEMKQIAELYIKRRAERHLQKKRIVIFAGGTGNPFFSTDTLAALRAAEISANVILMAKNNVDGVYNVDPKINKKAIMFKELTHLEMISKKLKIIDATASSLSMVNNIPIVIFNLNKINNILNVCLGKNIGTKIKKKGN